MDHLDAPPELMSLPPCDCCGVPVSSRRGSPWHGQHRICSPCFFIWYDEGIVNPAELKRRRLELYGTAPDLPPIGGGLFDQ
jgi:hypothetical protein